MPKMYDFGADRSNVSVNERKAIAWPIAVWSCYIPESESQDLNILENLILQLVKNGFKNPREVLCNKVGFNKDLVDAALESCLSKGFFDRRYTREFVLAEKGKAFAEKIANPYIEDLTVSKSSKKVYMIQDLVTKSVVPVFDIEKLPEFYVEDDNALQVHYTDYSWKKPKSASIKTAIRYWTRLCDNRRKGVAYGSNTIDVSQPPTEEGDIEDFIPFEDEVDWESVQEEETILEERTLADKEEEEIQQQADNEIKNVTILDDEPDLYYARGFIAINRNAPDEAIIVSPFGSRLDDWFRTVVNRLRSCDNEFEEEIQFFLEIKRDELKDYIAFGNDLKIKLFDEYPFVCNEPEYNAVKKQIERLTVSKNRFQNGEDDSINFAQALRSSYEASLRLVAKKNSELFISKNLEYEEYKKNLRCLVDSYSFLSDDVFREYSSYGMYRNMTLTSEDDGYATAFFALLLMDAWDDQHGKSMDLIRNLPELPVRLKALTSNLKRDKNKKGQGAAASHGGDAGAALKFSEKKVLDQYEEFENIFRAIYNRFMEDV